MFRSVLFIGIIVLMLPSAGLADCGCEQSADEWGTGHVQQDAAGPTFWLGPDVLVVFDYTEQETIAGPGGATAIQCICIASSETTGAGSQGAYAPASQTTIVSGNGTAWVDSDVVIVIWQRQP